MELKPPRAFLDAMFLGIVLVVFSFWWTDARPTERFWTRVLVVREPEGPPAEAEADGRQYWLIFAGICATTALQGSAMVRFVEGFGVYRGFFDVTCAAPKATHANGQGSNGMA